MLSLTINPLSANNGAPTQGDAFFSGADQGLSFKDILDTVNPLQQIPIVSTIYRALTGDDISAASRLAGGALYGGPIGFIMSLADEVMQTQTGHDIGGNVLALLDGGGGSGGTSNFSSNDYGNGAGAPLSANQRFAYNAYLHTQNLLA